MSADLSYDEWELVADVLEMALSDPDFIDTTSGGGHTAESAHELRQRMRTVQRKAHTAQACMKFEARDTLAHLPLAGVIYAMESANITPSDLLDATWKEAGD